MAGHLPRSCAIHQGHGAEQQGGARIHEGDTKLRSTPTPKVDEIASVDAELQLGGRPFDATVRCDPTVRGDGSGLFVGTEPLGRVGVWDAEATQHEIAEWPRLATS